MTPYFIRNLVHVAHSLSFGASLTAYSRSMFVTRPDLRDPRARRKPGSGPAVRLVRCFSCCNILILPVKNLKKPLHFTVK